MANVSKLLAFDPSLTATGYAVLQGPNVLLDAGVLTPKPTRGAVLQRCESLAAQASGIWRECQATTVVIETPGKRPPRGLRMTARVGQGNYGFCCGFLVAMFNYCYGAPPRTVAVPADEWTTIGKVRRTEVVAYRFPQYRPERDKGQDAADAIGLALWWYEQQAKGHSDG